MRLIKLLSIFALLLLPYLSYGQNSEQIGGIIMKGQYDGPNHEGPPIKHTPLPPVYVYQNEHNFIFASYHSGEVVEILDGENLLYTSAIGEDGQVVVPEYIVGKFLFRLVRLGVTYQAIVNL